jgi:L-ascorbate metabolism protein UlaG (beta-lactamase superfamily)
MDIEHAVKASEWLNTTAVIPMHYNTFAPISVDIADFEKRIRAVGKMPLIMKVGEVIND